MCCYRYQLVFNCCFKTLIFHKVLQRHIWGMVWSLVSVITNFLLIPTVKTVWKLVNIWWSYKAYKKCAKFFGPPCIYCTCLSVSCVACLLVSMYLHLVTITLSLPDMHHIVKLPRKEWQRRTVRAKKMSSITKENHGQNSLRSSTNIKHRLTVVHRLRWLTDTGSPASCYCQETRRRLTE